MVVGIRSSSESSEEEYKSLLSSQKDEVLRHSTLHEIMPALMRCISLVSRLSLLAKNDLSTLSECKAKGQTVCKESLGIVLQRLHNC